MERKAARPRYLSLPMNRDSIHLSNQNTNRYLIAWIVACFVMLIRRLKFILKVYRFVMTTVERKVFFCSMVICSAIIAVFITKFPRKSSYSWNGSQGEIQCLDENIVYFHGRLECQNIQSVRYLSYQPPGGGWNNQRIAFENAVVLAKLLNRTLIVHPLAPHQEILQLKKRRRISAGYEVYNMLPKEKLLPLSKVIDLKLLSKVVPVKEFASDHAQFHNRYNHLKWGKVCHNGLLGTWVDSVPKKTDQEKWKRLQQHMKRSLPSYKEIPVYRRICKEELRNFGNNASSDRPVWGIMDELLHKTEDLIYFSEGSLYNRELLFFDRKTVLNAHQWIMQFVHFASDIRNRVMAVLEKLEHPFSAIHVRRTDHPSSFQIKQDFWLWSLRVRQALNLTRTLYIATDERNKTWFQPFREAGYNVFFADDFNDQLQVKNIPTAVVQDVLGLCEQLICAHADHFVGSYYSTFTMYIKRLRKQFSWKTGMLRKPYTSITWAGSSLFAAS